MSQHSLEPSSKTSETLQQQITQEISANPTKASMLRYHGSNPNELKASMGFIADALEDYSAEFTTSELARQMTKKSVLSDLDLSDFSAYQHTAGVRTVRHNAAVDCQKVMNVAGNSLPKSFLHELIVDAATQGHSVAVKTLVTKALAEATPLEAEAFKAAAEKAQGIVQVERGKIQKRFNELYVQFKSQSVLGQARLGFRNDSAKKDELLELANLLASYDKIAATLENPNKQAKIHKNWFNYYNSASAVVHKDAKEAPKRSSSSETAGSAPAATPPQPSSPTGLTARFATLFGRSQADPRSEPLLAKAGKNGYASLSEEDSLIQGGKPQPVVSSDADDADKERDTDLVMVQ